MKRQTKTSILLVAALVAVAGLALYRLHQPGVTRAGLGAIGTGAAHVLVRGDRNQIQWQEGEVIHHWVGRPRTQPETVYFDGHDVQPAAWAAVFSRKGFLVRFLPHRIDVIDLGDLKGSYYSR